MIKVQIECLRIVRCLLLLRIDDSLYRCVSIFNFSNLLFIYLFIFICNIISRILQTTFLILLVLFLYNTLLLKTPFRSHQRHLFKIAF